jgi:acyl CoA:acetate/3-ketoacid CoA transferase alpha subunit
MKTAIRAHAAAALIPDGATLLIAGFMPVGTPGQDGAWHGRRDGSGRRGAAVD